MAGTRTWLPDLPASMSEAQSCAVLSGGPTASHLAAVSRRYKHTLGCEGGKQEKQLMGLSPLRYPIWDILGEIRYTVRLVSPFSLYFIILPQEHLDSFCLGAVQPL